MDREYYIARIERSSMLHAGWRRVIAAFDESFTDEDLTLINPYDSDEISRRSLQFTQNTLCGKSARQVLSQYPYGSYVPRTNEQMCPVCAQRFSAWQAPDIEGWTKTCGVCLRELVINKFPADRRRRDGLSAICLECKTTTEEMKRHHKRHAELLAFRQQRADEALARATTFRLSMQAWQDSPIWPTLTCACGEPYRTEVQMGDSAQAVLVCCDQREPDWRLAQMIQQAAQMSEYLELHLDITGRRPEDPGEDLISSPNE